MLLVFRWLRRACAAHAKCYFSRRRSALALESLEDRVVPTFQIATTTLLAVTNANQFYQTAIQTSGGTLANIQVSAGQPPTGVSLNNMTGDVTGTPSVAGESEVYTLTATDTLGETTTQTYSSLVLPLPSQFDYNANTQQLTINLDQANPNLQFSQATIANPNGSLTTTYAFELFDKDIPTNPVTVSIPAAGLTANPPAGGSSVIVNGVGGKAVLISNDTYPTTGGTVAETPETFYLGSLNNAGFGTMAKFPNNDKNQPAYTFLSLNNFPFSYAYEGRNDPTTILYGTTGVGTVGFVSAGWYSYIGATNGAFFHEAAGANNVYGYSPGNATDFAYHYSMNPGSAYVMSGIAFSYMSGREANPENKNAIDTFFNVGVGFRQNTGVAQNPGADYAYFIDSRQNDIYIGANGYSYMYIGPPPSPFAEFDAAFGFAIYYAQSFVGGSDFANRSSPSNNIFAGNWMFF